MTIKLPFDTTEDIARATDFVAGLVKNGLTFSAHVHKYEMVITLTGGF